MLNIQLIKTKLQQLGLRPESLAEQCDVSIEVVSSWLSGEAIPRPKKLKALAEALKVEVSQLYLPDESAPVIAFGACVQKR